MADLYRSETLLVRSFPGRDRARWVITFDNHGAETTLDRPGFAQQFLISRGISTVTVVCAGNDWYQYADMSAALATIGAAVAGAARVLTYGSSMGAYAAVRFADAVGANACLALSPQYSNDPAKVPFEQRWPQEARAIAWLPTLDGPIRCAFRPTVVFDDRGPDGRHAALIAADTPIDAVPIPYAAHPVTTFLSSAGLLERLVLRALVGRMDPQMLRLKVGRRRHRDPIVVCELARLQPAHRPRLGIKLARRALALAPHTDLMCHILARKLTAVKEFDEALTLHARAVALSHGHIGYKLPYSEALEAAGQRAHALTIAAELADQHPNYAQIMYWYGKLLSREGRREEATRALERSYRLNPRNRRYRLAFRLAWARAALLTAKKAPLAPLRSLILAWRGRLAGDRYKS